MIVITNCEIIDLDRFEHMHCDPDKAMVEFQSPKESRRLYFQCARNAKEFVLEIIEAIYNRQNIIDLSHFPAVPDRLHIANVTSEIQTRLKK